MASCTYAQVDRNWSGSVGAIATIAVHVFVLLLFVSSREKPHSAAGASHGIG